MAGDTIDQVAITQFSDMVHVAAQQNRARLRPYVQIKPMVGEKFAYDGLGAIEASEIIGRHQPVVFSDISHNRRKISRRRFQVTLPIDASDVRSMLLNPQGDYAAACVRAMERVFDRVVVEAMFVSVYTGAAMDTAVTFANDGGHTVTATGGINYEDLLDINQNFIDHEVGNDVPEQIVMGIAGNEHTALMKETELISGDFTRNYVVEKGRIVQAAGIQLIHFAGGVNNPILDVNSSVRDCFAMTTRAMCVGMSKEMGLKVEGRSDLVETTQVQIIFDLGAVRTEGVLLQKVQTTAS
jgi:hypothetical protein